VVALARAERFDEAGALAQQISDEGKRTAALKRVVGALAKAERFDEARTLTQQISDEGRRSEALITIAQDQAEVAQWEAIISVIGEAASITTRHYGAISHFLSTLPHLPTVLTLVQRLWSQAQTRDALYALLPAAAPLFIADPTLLPQILAGEEWVKEQLRW
jgi:thioredoxin-like negative regulator of GroEL